MGAMAEFYVQDKRFTAEVRPDATSGFEVASCPRPYRVDFRSEGSPAANLAREIHETKDPVLLADSRVLELYLKEAQGIASIPVISIEAKEEAKEITTVLGIVDFLEDHNITKTSMLFVVGAVS